MSLRIIIQMGISLMAYIALIFVTLAALMTCLDVVLRQTPMGSPIRGLIDLTQLMVMYAVFFSIAYGFARQSHVAVTALTESLPIQIDRALRILWWLVSVGVLTVLSYAAFNQARLVFSYGDVSQNIRIPMIWYWIPVVAGLLLSALGSLWAVADVLGEAKGSSK